MPRGLRRLRGHGEPLQQHPNIELFLEKGFSCIFDPLDKIMVFVFQSEISIIEFVLPHEASVVNDAHSWKEG